MKSIRRDHAATIVNDALFITGGHGIDKFSSGSHTHMASSEYIYANGTVESGPNLPESRQGHCSVTLHDGKVLILGAETHSGAVSLRKNVMIYDADDHSFTTGPSMNYDRRLAACTVFKSPLHNNRPVVLVAGGFGQNTAEVYDYTNANQWQTSIYLLCSNL